MAIQFPDSPNNGETYVYPLTQTEYMYNSTENSWAVVKPYESLWKVSADGLLTPEKSTDDLAVTNGSIRIDLLQQLVT